MGEIDCGGNRVFSDGQGHAQWIFNQIFIVSVGGWGCIPFLLFDLRPNYGRGNEDNPAKGLVHALLYSMPLNLQQATVNPHLHWRLLDTHRQVWISLLCGHCSFLLSPGVQKVLFVPSNSLFLQTCVSFVISSLGVLSPFARSPGWEIYCRS